MKIAFIGGDARTVVIGRLFADEGHDCYCYGLEKYPEGTEPIKQACPEECLRGASAVILPLPCTEKGGARIFAPFSDNELTLNDITSRAEAGTVICGGMTGESGITDYYDEPLQIRNAIPTAEGAIAIALEEMPVTLCGSKTLILGFGRIGRCLAERLKALGSSVTVAMRKETDRAWAENMGVDATDFRHLEERLKQSDAVFNTVPSTVLRRSELECVRMGVPVIDLASRPGGLDFGEAGRLGVKVIWALSLPGKYAPVTAGEAIFKSIKGIFSDWGIMD